MKKWILFGIPQRLSGQLLRDCQGRGRQALGRSLLLCCAPRRVPTQVLQGRYERLVCCRRNNKFSLPKCVGSLLDATTPLIPTRTFWTFTSAVSRKVSTLQIYAYTNFTSSVFFTTSTMATTPRHAKFRQKSFETTRDDHIPKLTNMLRAPPVIFLGSWISEGMGTTGKWENKRAWPSEAMMSPERLGQLSDSRVAQLRGPLLRIGGTFNAGCGGDSVANTLHRLIGFDNVKVKKNVLYRWLLPSGRKYHKAMCTALGLRDVLLMRKGEVHLWVVDVAADNFERRLGTLKETSAHALRELLLAIFGMSSPATQVLLTGVPCHSNATREVIDTVNEQLRDLALEISQYIQILDHDRRRVGLKQCEMLGNIWWDMTKEPTEEDITRHDSVISRLLTHTTNGHLDNQAANIVPDGAFISLAAKLEEAAHIARLESNIARFDFATMSAPMEPKPRIEFLPMPGDIRFRKHPKVDESLSLEAYQQWTEALFPKAREMLDRAESRHQVVRAAERAYHQRLPEYTPRRKWGTFYKKRIKNPKPWTCKGSNWLVVNPNSLDKLRSQMRREGMVVGDSDEDERPKSDNDKPDASKDPPSKFARLKVDEMDARQKAGQGARDGSPSSEGSYIIEADMYMPGSGQQDSESIQVSDSRSSSRRSSPPSRPSPPTPSMATEAAPSMATGNEPSIAGVSRRQMIRARIAGVVRRLKVGRKQRY